MEFPSALRRIKARSYVRFRTNGGSLCAENNNKHYRDDAAACGRMQIRTAAEIRARRKKELIAPRRRVRDILQPPPRARTRLEYFHIKYCSRFARRAFAARIVDLVYRGLVRRILNRALNRVIKYEGRFVGRLCVCACMRADANHHRAFNLNSVSIYTRGCI